MTDQLRIFAGLHGFVSAAGLLALLLFFALATPFRAEQGRWAWLGPVNDWLYVLGAAPWIIALVLLVVRVRGGLLLWVLTGILCVLITAGAIVTALMRSVASSCSPSWWAAWWLEAPSCSRRIRRRGWCSSSRAGFRSRSR